jgi:hypothetical protein
VLGSGWSGLLAQGITVTGRVVRGTTRQPLARAWVVLHEVSMGGDGRPIDSTRTDGQGGYTMAIRRPDSAAIYVVSSWYAGIAYFSEPLVPARRATGRLRPIAVYDTSSAGPAVALSRRLVTIARPKQDGTRDVLELLELENPGEKTRVPPDTLRPTWTGAIPQAAIQFRVGQGDLSPQAVTLRGDSVEVFAPIPPGERKQLSYAYVLPADVRAVTVPIDQPTAEVDLLLEDTAAVVTAGRLDSLGVEDLEGRRFARYRMRDVAPRAALAIALPQGGLHAQTLVPVVVLLAAIALGIGFVVALRRKPIASPGPAR